jgi:hypothetical protein
MYLEGVEIDQSGNRLCVHVEIDYTKNHILVNSDYPLYMQKSVS